MQLTASCPPASVTGAVQRSKILSGINGQSRHAGEPIARPIRDIREFRESFSSSTALVRSFAASRIVCDCARILQLGNIQPFRSSFVRTR